MVPAKCKHGLAIGAFCALAAFGAHRLGLLNWIEHPAWDLRVRLFARPGPHTDDIRLILLDQTSLDWASDVNGLSWPWPREVYAPIIDFCSRAGARSVVFDMLFTEPSRYGVDDDARLGDAVARSGRFVAALFLGRDQGSARAWPASVRPPFADDGNAASVPGAPVFARLPLATFPVADVATNAAALGNVYGQSEHDAIVRRTPALAYFDNHPVPSLGLAAWLASQPRAAVPVSTPGRLRVAGAPALPLDRHGRVILRFRGPSQTHRAVNAAAVIQSELKFLAGETPRVDPAFFKDKHVFFGVTAPGLLDLKPTPISRIYPGVEVHATFLDNLMTGDFLSDVSPAVVAALTLLLALGAGTATRYAPGGWQTALVLAASAGTAAAAGLLAYPRGYWLPIAPPLAAALSASVAATIVNYALEGRQKRFIKSAFRQYLSPAVIDRLLQDPGQLKLGGESRELSIFFSDIQGFSGISERMEPEALTALLNEYLTAMTDIILASGGTVDKYEGDAIIAFWNAPLGQPDHARRAVDAALACQAKLAELADGFAARIGKPLVTRIGINTGKVVVGNMGSDQRFDYTFLGDAGNLASRLEGINKQFGTRILVSEFTRRILGDGFHGREISRVRVVGRDAPVTVFEPATPAAAARDAAAFAAFDAALKRYYAGDIPAALGAFETLAGDDPVAAAYAARCRALPTPVPPDWTGVWTMTEK